MAKAKKTRNYQVLVRRRNLKGWRTISFLGRTRFTRARAEGIAKLLKKRGRAAKLHKVIDAKTANDHLIKDWLSGDLDFDRLLMVKLARAAHDSNTPFYVNYGKRTYQEQLALWNRYGPPRAARPGTSRHETGLAADVVTKKGGKNIGQVDAVRKALKKHGLCLPVPNEPWHVEKGNTWRS